MLLVATGLAVATTWPRDAHHAGAAGSGCRGEEMVRVLAAPSIAPAITTVAATWVATHPAVNRICV